MRESHSEMKLSPIFSLLLRAVSLYLHMPCSLATCHFLGFLLLLLSFVSRHYIRFLMRQQINKICFRSLTINISDYSFLWASGYVVYLLLSDITLFYYISDFYSLSHTLRCCWLCIPYKLTTPKCIFLAYFHWTPISVCNLLLPNCYLHAFQN